MIGPSVIADIVTSRDPNRQAVVTLIVRGIMTINIQRMYWEASLGLEGHGFECDILQKIYMISFHSFISASPILTHVR